MTDLTNAASEPSGNPPPPRVHRIALVALLLAATLGLGAAARLAARPAPTPGTAHASDGALSLAAHVDRSSVLQGGDGLVRVELVLRGREAPRDALLHVPTDLVVVLDRSGSMQGHPIHTARAAVRELIGGLGSGDRFALVSYSNGASVDVPLEPASPAARARWLRRVERLAANGGTDLSSGLDAAHALLARAERTGRAPRVIVLSDGLANQGDYSLAGLRGRASRARGGEYVLSAVGVGSGFDETVMSALADAGTGNFYYLPDVERLAGIFADEFAAARETVARALSIRIDPAHGVRVADASGYPLETAGDGSLRIRPGDLFAGQERRIWLTLHAPTGAVGDRPLGGVAVDFASPAGEPGRVEIAVLPQVACVANDDDYYASFDAEVYNRANLSSSLGALKQSVARKIKEGRQEEAVAEVEDYRVRSEAEQMRALGYVAKDEAAELDALADVVSAPAAAEPEVRNHLGKQLLESGRDAQRSGAKK